MTLSMSKRKPNSRFLVRKYLLFTGKLDLYSDYKFYRGSCLICRIRSYGTAGQLSQCYNSSKKIMYDPWTLAGLNPSFFVIWGGLVPLSPYVEPPPLYSSIRCRCCATVDG